MSARPGLIGLIDYRVWMLRRATAVPLTLRAGLGAVVFACLSVAFFGGALRPLAYGIFAGLALLVALFPRTLLVTLTIVVAAVGWLATGSDYASGLGFIRLWLLAFLIYLVHTSAAMAAVLPYDALVTPGTFVPWMRRSLVVGALTGGLAFAIAELPDLIGGKRQVVASLVGLGVTLAIAGYLTLLGRRRRGA